MLGSFFKLQETAKQYLKDKFDDLDEWETLQYQESLYEDSSIDEEKEDTAQDKEREDSAQDEENEGSFEDKDNGGKDDDDDSNEDNDDNSESLLSHHKYEDDGSDWCAKCQCDREGHDDEHDKEVDSINNNGDNDTDKNVESNDSYSRFSAIDSSSHSLFSADDNENN